MFDKIFSFLGGTFGKMLGGGILSTIGRCAGTILGNYIKHSLEDPQITYSIKNLKDSFNLRTATYGSPIPLMFGIAKIEGKIIWAEKMKKLDYTESNIKYFKDPYIGSLFKQKKAINYTISYEYYLTFAIAICEGEITEINRIWANDELLDLSNYKFNIYNGSEDQMPDPILLKSMGDAPAFRDLAYIIFYNLPMADFNNQIPSFSFEVKRKPNIKFNKISNNEPVENLVTAITMIPGSGEFVYDTQIQYKTIRNKYNMEIAKETINSHNRLNIANSIYSLNQLQTTCPNIKYIAPVVCWFGNNLNAGICDIKPGIEFNEKFTEYTENWFVEKYSRDNAYQISRNVNNQPNYGGTPTDSSIKRYLEEIKKRGIKIMFYPMIFLDLKGKTWRGYLTAQTQEEISQFFNKINGYNNFILHYAKLVKEYADIFIIGSELKTLTNIRINNDFPAVNELINLAMKVKNIMNPNTKITYAADWSEYHHNQEGFFHLDKLWASNYIDFIGIDAYFPITDKENGPITEEDIKNGFNSGEGYDYYLDHNNAKQPLNSAYAWKNIRYWWENAHINPDGTKTLWEPKMKKIYFTEFGFPSIDKATNQPNIFFDPLSRDGGIPKYSSGESDFSIQRKAIKAFIEYWRKEEYIEGMFLWTWDARPYPSWPHMNIWNDSNLWEKGHWINNKFGTCTIGSIIMEISKRCKIPIENIDVTNLDDTIEGMLLELHINAISAINLLRIKSFFDITANIDKNYKIYFTKRISKTPLLLEDNYFVKKDNHYFKEEEIDIENTISQIILSYTNQINDYKKDFIIMHNENNFIVKHCIYLPMVISENEAESISRLILKNAIAENKIIKFFIPKELISFMAGNFLKIIKNNKDYIIRIIEVKILNDICEIIGIYDEYNNYQQNFSQISYIKTNINNELNFKYFIIELPFNLDKSNNYPEIIIYFESTKNNLLFLKENNIEEYRKITKLSPEKSIGNLVQIKQIKIPNIFLIDYVSQFTIMCNGLKNFINNDEWHLALCGNEIIYFKNVKLIEENIYEISEIVRGAFATDLSIYTHNIGERFILLEKYSEILKINEAITSEIKNKELDLYFKIGNNEKIKLEFKNLSQRPLPVFFENLSIKNDRLMIKWRARSKYNNWDNDNIICGKYMVEIYIKSERYIFYTKDEYLDISFSALSLNAQRKLSIIYIDNESYTSQSEWINF